MALSQKKPDEIFPLLHFLLVLIEQVDLAYHNLLGLFLLFASSGPLCIGRREIHLLVS